jgi:hypothetical protein
MKLRIALEDKLFDVRLKDRHLTDGKIKNEEMKDFYSNLEDNTGKFEEVKIGEKVTKEDTLN